MPDRRLLRDPLLAIYLRQTGAIPQLTRDEELTLAMRVVRARRRFQRAVLANGLAWPQALRIAREVCAGKRSLAQSFDVLGESKEARQTCRELLPSLLDAAAAGARESRRHFAAWDAAADAEIKRASRRLHLAARRKTVRVLGQMRFRDRVLCNLLNLQERIASAGEGKQRPAEASSPLKAGLLARIERMTLLQGLEPPDRLRRRCLRARQWLAAYRGAARELTTANLRLVVTVASRFRYPDATLSDVVQDGNTGLMRAAERYDPRRGATFAAYAAIWIRQAITLATARRQSRSRRPMSIDAEDRDGSGRTFAGHLADAGTIDPVEDAMLAARRGSLDQALNSLDECESTILRGRFGIDGRPQSYRQLARQLKLTVHAVRLVEATAIRKLRAPETAGLLEEYAADL